MKFAPQRNPIALAVNKFPHEDGKWENGIRTIRGRRTCGAHVKDIYPMPPVAMERINAAFMENITF